MDSKRLKLVSSFLREDDVFADVGCDHGLLGQYAYEKGIRKIQLIDNKEGPLSQAKANLAPLIDKCTITFTLADGLSSLMPDINVIAICGIGGNLLVEILERDLEKAKSLARLILQPNTHIPNVRAFLSHQGFVILDEAIIKEKRKIYEIIVARFQDFTPKLSVEDCYFGPILRLKPSPVFVEKHRKRLNQITKILNKPLSQKRYHDLNQEKLMLLSEINRC
ncbi:MAG: class I SAM-dependent methyltransferase [Bacilli bacterium]|jgi:tRNA (adenine22-N1)-methyltransferase|nr:class I SAM-dependent methyltransferase [Bacilli bacterium]HHU24564.1 SAM-dependent methyltransferase [Acholeplasmataceae bacterium]